MRMQHSYFESFWESWVGHRVCGYTTSKRSSGLLLVGGARGGKRDIRAGATTRASETKGGRTRVGPNKSTLIADIVVIAAAAVYK